MTFVTPEGEVTASEGDLITVPPGAIHTFKNASETEDCECYMTATPGKYRRPGSKEVLLANCIWLERSLCGL